MTPERTGNTPARPENHFLQGQSPTPSQQAQAQAHAFTHPMGADWPTVVHHKDGGARTVHSQEQFDSMGPDWRRQPWPKVTPDEAKAATCQGCVNLTADNADLKSRFDRAWSDRDAKHAAEISQYEYRIQTLQEQNAALMAELEKKPKKG